MSVPSKSGFTLLELLASIALLSFISMLIYRAVFQFSDGSERVLKILEARQELRLLGQIVLDDLQRVQYLTNFVILNSKEEQYQTGIISKRFDGPESQPASAIHFHTAGETRFFNEATELKKDPELHEVGYWLVRDPLKNEWIFQRREDFYIDSDMTEGGKFQTLSKRISLFQLQFLSQNIVDVETGQIQEVWLDEWDSAEQKCSPTPSAGSEPCLPLAIRLMMGITSETGEEYLDTLEFNLPLSLQR